MTSTQLFFVHALSPLHAGTGQSIGAIDLAIARDRATQFPYLPGSSIKGSLRDVARQEFAQNSTLVIKLFGPETANASDHAGALIVSDANLLLLPVRSVAGTFAWVTSPYLLHRFARDAKAANVNLSLPKLPSTVGSCVVGKSSALLANIDSKDKVIFEDLDLDPAQDASVDTLADALGKWIFAESSWQGLLKHKLCIVHDDVMTFLSEHATDVVARIALEDESKTVKNGQLWYEESLPTESILVGLVHAQPTAKVDLRPDDVLSHAKPILNASIQLGGKATVGRGRCQLRLGVAP